MSWGLQKHWLKRQVLALTKCSQSAVPGASLARWCECLGTFLERTSAENFTEPLEEETLREVPVADGALACVLEMFFVA